MFSAHFREVVSSKTALADRAASGLASSLWQSIRHVASGEGMMDPNCNSIGSLKIDAAISHEVLRVIKSVAIDSAVKAIEAQSRQTTGNAGHTRLR